MAARGRGLLLLPPLFPDKIQRERRFPLPLLSHFYRFFCSAFCRERGRERKRFGVGGGGGGAGGGGGRGDRTV